MFIKMLIANIIVFSKIKTISKKLWLKFLNFAYKGIEI